MRLYYTFISVLAAWSWMGARIAKAINFTEGVGEAIFWVLIFR
jgi:hypothetical protein